MDRERETSSHSLTPTEKEDSYPADQEAVNLFCRRKDGENVLKREDLERTLQRCPFTFLPFHPKHPTHPVLDSRTRTELGSDKYISQKQVGKKKKARAPDSLHATHPSVSERQNGISTSAILCPSNCELLKHKRQMF